MSEVNIYKTNLATNDYDNLMLFSDRNDGIIREKTFTVFELPNAKNFITIFILVSNLNNLNHVQLVNCIASIKVQTYININICVICMDNSPYARALLEKIAEGTNVDFVLASTSNISVAIDNAVKNCSSEYVSVIDCTDLIPRIRDIENIVQILFEKQYDYLSLKVTYKNKNGNDFNLRTKIINTLKSNSNFHYSAFFKTNLLKKYKFSQLLNIPLDESMINYLENLPHIRGNHIISSTQMNILGSFTKK